MAAGPDELVKLDLELHHILRAGYRSYSRWNNNCTAVIISYFYFYTINSAERTKTGGPDYYKFTEVKLTSENFSS